MIFRSERQDPEALWRSIMEPLWLAGDYESRLDALLAAFAGLTGLTTAYLYLADESGRRFHLERRRGAPAPARPSPGAAEPQTAGVAASPLAPAAGGGPASPRPPVADGDEGGAGAIVATPPLELPRTEETETAGTLATPVGVLYSLPLEHQGELVGLIQAGPLAGELPARARRRVEAARLPLALAVRQTRGEELLRQRLAAAAAREEAGRRLAGSALDLGRFLDLLLGLALRATRTEAGFVAIVEPGSRRPEVRAEAGLPPGVAERIDLEPESGLFDWTPAAEGALVLRDSDQAAALGIRSLLAVPLTEGAEPLGIFALVNFGESGTFAEHSLDLLATFAEQIRLMLQNSRLFESFADRYLETVKGLARSLDVRRPHTHGHHEAVGRAAAAIAERIGVGERELEAIRTAGLIHDVGLAGVAEGGGYEADLEHPAVGASLVEHLPLHPAVAGSIAAHHEWYDGWGFPRGLKGEEIPLGGRILALAEFLAEMAAGDPVRPPWPSERLAAEVAQRRGTHFDPRVADAALHLIDRLPLWPAGTGANEEEKEEV